MINVSWVRSLSIVTRLQVEQPVFGSWLERGRNFSFRHHVPAGSGSFQSSVQWGTGTRSPRAKGCGREADHSHLSSIEVRNAQSYTSCHPYVFVAWCLVNHRDKFMSKCWSILDLGCR